MKNKFHWTWIALVGLLALAGCQTQTFSPADKWLSENLGPREKAAILVDQGIDRYNRMVDDDAVVRIPQVKAVFQLALDTWPQDPRAPEWLKKVDGFKDRRSSEVQAKAKTLAAKAGLTDKEKYTLVLLVRELQVLAPPDVDLTKLTTQIAPVRAEVIKRQIQILADDEAVLKTAKTDQAAAKALGVLHDAIEALRSIDPQNPAADGSARHLSDYLAARTKDALEAAWKAYGAKDYSAALKELGFVEQSLAGTGTMASDEVTNLHYKVSFDWAKDLFGRKKVGEAGIRINDALSVRVTAEARDLRDKISAAALFRDYDAEYDDLDRQLDALAKAGDLKAAWVQTLAIAPQLKKDDNKARLELRRKQILDAAHALYDKAVASYNDEDYQEAEDDFDVVVAVDPSWQLAKAYLDKARAKIQALGAN